MDRRQTIGTLLTLGVLLNPLAALAEAPGPKQPMVVWYSIKAPYCDQFDQLLKGYETNHPYLDIQTRNFADAEAMRTALNGTGAMPDVALIDASWQNELISGQKLVPMEDLMAGASNMARIVCKADTFSPLFQLSLKDGKLWTLPTFATDTALIYNPKMFKAKKILAPPANWGEMLTDAKMLTDVKAGVWGFELPINQTGTDMGHLFSVMLWQMGADLTNLEEPLSVPVTAAADGLASAPKDADPKASPSTAPAAASPSATAPPAATPTPTSTERLLNFLVDMVYRYKVSSSTAADDPTKFAMMFGTPETLLAAESKGLSLNAAPFPFNKVKVSEMTMYNFAVTKDARDPNEAYQFANWAAGFEQSVVWTTTTPYLPANRQVTLSPQYFQYLNQHPGLRVFLKEMNVGRLQPLVPHYRRVLAETTAMVVAAVVTHAAVGDAVHAIVDKTRYILNMPHTGSTEATQVH